MYQIYDDSGDVVVTAENKAQAHAKYLAQQGAAGYELRLTPEVLTAMSNESRPFSTLHRGRAEWVLSETIADYAPLFTIARESVIAELELITRQSDTPDDVSPLDSDRHIEELRQWLDDNIDSDSFRDGLVQSVTVELTEEMEDEIMELWSAVTERIGIPARATTTEIQGEIERLED